MSSHPSYICLPLHFMVLLFCVVHWMEWVKWKRFIYAIIIEYYVNLVMHVTTSIGTVTCLLEKNIESIGTRFFLFGTRRTFYSESASAVSCLKQTTVLQHTIHKRDINILGRKIIVVHFILCRIRQTCQIWQMAFSLDFFFLWMISALLPIDFNS